LRRRLGRSFDGDRAVRFGQPGDLVAQRTRGAVIRLFFEHFVEHGERSIAVTLTGVDFRERDRRDGRGHRRQRRLLQPADERRSVRQMQPSLDDAGHEIAGYAEQSARQTPLEGIGHRPFDDLVDELGAGQDVRFFDAECFRARDEIAATDGFDLGGVEGAHRG
jgi:hypothetical protein